MYCKCGLVMVGVVKFIHLFKIRELWKFRISRFIRFISINAIFPQFKKLHYVFLALWTEVKCDSSWYEGHSDSWENQRSYLHALTVFLAQFQACFILGGYLNSVYPDLRTAQANCVWTAQPGLPGWLYEELKDLWPSDPQAAEQAWCPLWFF